MVSFTTLEAFPLSRVLLLVVAILVLVVIDLLEERSLLVLVLFQSEAIWTLVANLATDIAHSLELLGQESNRAHLGSVSLLGPPVLGPQSLLEGQ